MNQEINKIIGKVMEVTGYHYDMVVNGLTLKEITDIYEEHTVMYLVDSEQLVSDEEVESMRKSGIIAPSNESVVERDTYLRLKKELEEVEEKFREEAIKNPNEIMIKDKTDKVLATIKGAEINCDSIIADDDVSVYVNGIRLKSNNELLGRGERKYGKLN